MNILNNILSSIDPTAVNQSSTQAGRQTPTTNTPRPAQRPAPGSNGTAQTQPLKRKAEGQPDSGQAKIQRKDAPVPSGRAILPTRAAPTPGVTKPKADAHSNAVPYRGTAGSGGLGATKAAEIIAKKPSPVVRATSALAKPTAPPPSRMAGAATAPKAAPVPTKKGSYAAMLQAAAQKDQAKPAAPPVKHEVPKFLKRKELEALKKADSAAAKGKKPNMAVPGKVTSTKGEPIKEKRKPADLGYQGTARPAKKPVDIGYKGTAKPVSTPVGATGKAAKPVATKVKPRVGQGRYGGYASWSDDEMDGEEEEEEDYDSEGSSDMEANPFDMDDEEEAALKAAKREDALALKEENELRALKMKKLAAMAKAAGQKKRY